ncbi:hypothetical protein ACFC06_01955 [Nocardia sp. NPDC056064]|uniref:hypothetical protein n=1 Tax=Nocardia sp. NPDC056064 TaxID=3345701 RepID=UPI0035DB20EB
MTFARDDTLPGADRLRRLSVAYTELFYDADAALVLNPPGTHEEFAPPATLHMVPNSAWFAYGLLARGGPGDLAEAQRMLRAVLDLQLDGPGQPWDGTFRRFAEWPQRPPEGAIEWWDYDPNWRQFVACAFAVTLHRFESLLPDELASELAAAVERAVRSEPPGRIPQDYTNPRLMQVAARSWSASRRGDPAELAAAEAELERIAERHRARGGRFDEFNAPTYDGINLFALSLLCEISGSARIAATAQHLRDALWTQLDDFFDADLGNLTGPYSRAHFPDMNTYVALSALWIWARTGVRVGPAFEDAPHLATHGHDIMLGPLVADLADTWGPATLRTTTAPRTTTIELGDRGFTLFREGGWMLGVETSTGTPSWVGAQQRMPFVLHGRRADGQVGAIWARDGRWQVVLDDSDRVVLRVSGCTAIDSSVPPQDGADAIRLDGLRIEVITAAGHDDWQPVPGGVRRTPPDGSAEVIVAVGADG